MSVLRSLARWLLKDPGDADRAVAIDDGGTAQDAGHWMGPPVKDEPAASVHTFMLDPGIPACSKKAADFVRGLQCLHKYHPRTYQRNTVGWFHPPVEFKDFDEEYFHDLIPSHQYDLSLSPL